MTHFMPNEKFYIPALYTITAQRDVLYNFYNVTCYTAVFPTWVPNKTDPRKQEEFSRFQVGEFTQIKHVIQVLT